MHASERGNLDVRHCLHILSPSHPMQLQLPTVPCGKMRQKHSHMLLSTSVTLRKSAGQGACRLAWGEAGSVLGSQDGWGQQGWAGTWSRFRVGIQQGFLQHLLWSIRRLLRKYEPPLISRC